MEASAKLRNCPTSPRKMRMVANLIRGMEVEKALNVLHFNTKQPARKLEKLLDSAVSNWKVKNEGERPEESGLFVKEIFVDGARTLKRFRPAPQGRAYRIRKRSNHVTIIIDSKVQVQAPEEVQQIKEVAAPEVKETKKTKETKAPKAKKAAAPKAKAKTEKKTEEAPKEKKETKKSKK